VSADSNTDPFLERHSAPEPASGDQQAEKGLDSFTTFTGRWWRVTCSTAVMRGEEEEQEQQEQQEEQEVQKESGLFLNKFRLIAPNLSRSRWRLCSRYC